MEKTGPNTQSSVQLKLTTKGKYHWAIEVAFDASDNNFHLEALITFINEIDKKLKDQFPNNTSMSASSSRFSSVDEFDDDLD